MFFFGSTTYRTITNHAKSIRSLVGDPGTRTFASAGEDAIKRWHGRDGEFRGNFSQHHSGIVNTLALSADGVAFAGGHQGQARFYDWATGHCFQDTYTAVQEGSLAAEACVFGAAFDMSGTRLITAEGDKTVKIWRQVDQGEQGEGVVEYDPKMVNREKF
jgi:pleiotropic regulator 1